ncbi:5035_t:CDS:2 [Paraglomus brasilianum]|uniref:5035_t:CDS:1 n=1 Tax=Paraglomus brasilianum TaxID=144538 RepID=A0A9N8ZTC5_9GLOM|nr:5035_t:CDS:2 [Paraglomus brasilianum]
MSNSYIPITASYSLANQFSSPTLSIDFILKYINTLTPSESKLLLDPPFNVDTSVDILLNPINKNNTENNSPPRPQNAWVIFRKDFENRLRRLDPNHPHTVQDISKSASKSWKKQPDVVKKYFKLLSKLALKLHKETYPDYQYKPKVGRPKRKKKKWVFVQLDKDTFENCEYIKHNANKANERGVCTQDNVYENEHYQTNNCTVVQDYDIQCSSVNEGLNFDNAYYVRNDTFQVDNMINNGLISDSQPYFNDQINIDGVYQLTKPLLSTADQYDKATGLNIVAN